MDHRLFRSESGAFPGQAVWFPGWTLEGHASPRRSSNQCPISLENACKVVGDHEGQSGRRNHASANTELLENPKVIMIKIIVGREGTRFQVTKYKYTSFVSRNTASMRDRGLFFPWEFPLLGMLQTSRRRSSKLQSPCPVSRTPLARNPPAVPLRVTQPPLSQPHAASRV